MKSLQSFKPTLQKTLSFLRLTDENQVLSLTQIAFWVLIAKIALSPSPTLPEIAALLTVILNYSYKRYTLNKKETTSSEQDSKISALEEMVKELKDKVGKVSASLGMVTRRR